MIERMSAKPENLQSAIVFKIMASEQWNLACSCGTFIGSNDDVRDGFIHLSGPSQVIGTLEKYFSGQNDMMLVAFKSSDLGPNLKWEPSRVGQLFPHLYEPLQMRLALWQRLLTRGADGIAIVEESWLAC